MSLLFYVQTDTTVQIVTDTLVSDENRDPMMYQHKVKPFPHLNMIGVVTGFGSFGYQFFQDIDFTPGLRDIEHVNETAQETLRDSFKGWQEYHAPVDIGHATVHLFGFPEGSEKVVRYIYRAKNDFAPERHEGGSSMAVKPPPQQFELVYPDSPDEIVALAIKLRDENDELRTEYPVAIGGDLFVTFLSRNSSETHRIYQWPDHAEMNAAMPESIYKPRHPVDVTE
ncbi:hypothetical protein ASF63_12375 [Microbacterium sp. Leaf320]|nr:hypothetical protein ASF63_12375 [Microbacterium sp. Leaf320]